MTKRHLGFSTIKAMGAFYNWENALIMIKLCIHIVKITLGLF